MSLQPAPWKRPGPGVYIYSTYVKYFSRPIHKESYSEHLEKVITYPPAKYAQKCVLTFAGVYTNPQST